MGYEGAMLRNTNGEYLASADKASRSSDLVKLKPKHTDEFKIIGYTQGKRGKDKGAIIWICSTENDNEFNVTPKDMTYEERYDLFIDCEKNFDEKYFNKMMTVEYEDLSKAGVPQRAKAVIIRDYE